MCFNDYCQILGQTDLVYVLFSTGVSQINVEIRSCFNMKMNTYDVQQTKSKRILFFI